VPAEADSGKAVYRQEFGLAHSSEIAVVAGHETAARKQPGGSNNNGLTHFSGQDETSLSFYRSTAKNGLRLPLSSLEMDRDVIRSRLLADNQWNFALGGVYAHLESTTEIAPFVDLLAAPTACYAAWQSRVTSIPALEAVGRYCYHQGLVDTRRAIMQPSAALSDAVLAAALSLMDYEILACPDLHMMPYRWHRDACARMISLRGPARHKIGPGHELFLRFRIHAILEALEMRRPNFVCSRPWRKIPFAMQPGDMFNELLDIVADAPTTLSLADELQELEPTEAIDQLIKIARRVAEQATAMEHFYNGVTLQHGRLHWEDARPRESAAEVPTEYDMLVDEQGTVIPFFRFVTPDVARTLSFFWAFEAMMWSGISVMPKAAFAALGKDSKGLGDITQDECDSKWQSMCRRVCQSVADCTLVDVLNPGAGPGRISAPLNIIINIMQRHRYGSGELRWAMKTREQIGRRWIRMLCASRDADI
jgi:hypothetical protein